MTEFNFFREWEFSENEFDLMEAKKDITMCRLILKSLQEITNINIDFYLRCISILESGRLLSSRYRERLALCYLLHFQNLYLDTLITEVHEEAEAVFAVKEITQFYDKTKKTAQGSHEQQ